MSFESLCVEEGFASAFLVFQVCDDPAVDSSASVTEYYDSLSSFDLFLEGKSGRQVKGKSRKRIIEEQTREEQFESRSKETLHSG